MKKIQRQILSALLAAALLCGMVPVVAVENPPAVQIETDAVVNLLTEETVSEEPAAEETTEEVSQTEMAEQSLKLLELPTETLSGTCGDALTWSLTPEGVLTISGTGPMTDYQNIYDPAPWYTYGAEITQLVLNEGITHIGDRAF